MVGVAASTSPKRMMAAVGTDVEVTVGREPIASSFAPLPVPPIVGVRGDGEWCQQARTVIMTSVISISL